MAPTRVRIREVGPRDGFQNEPETIPTDEKVRLIDLLARTGLKRLEVTSFVRADVIPQLADAEQVLDAHRPAGRRRDLRPDPEREGARERAPPARALPRDQRLPQRLGDPQPQERQPLDRGVADRARGRARPRPRRGPALRGRDLRPPSAAPTRATSRPSACSRSPAGCRPPAPRRSASATPPAWPTPPRCATSSPPPATRSATASSSPPTSTTPAARASPTCSRRSRPASSRSSRASASSAAAPSRPAPPATSPPRTSSRCCTRWGSRPASSSSRLVAAARAAQEVLGRPLGSHVLTAGPVEWKG